MAQRIPVNPGEVEWCGDNPGIYLKKEAADDWSALAVFFRIVLSPHGRGHTLIVLEAPDEAAGYPQANNLCITDNAALSAYLIANFVARFPAFQGRRGLDHMTHLALDAVRSEGDMQTDYREVVRSGALEVVLQWENIGTPFAVEVGPAQCATRAHDMYSVFLEADEACITINGRPAAGRVVDRVFFGRPMRTAFLAISETWVTPRS